MDAALADQVRYYELLLAACRRRPAIHRAQIVALEAHLALAARASSGAELGAALEHGGHATALARAHQLDRFGVEHARAVALGDGLASRAAAQALESLAASGDAAFPGAVASTAAAMAGLTTASQVAEHASRLVEGAVDFACDWDRDRRGDAQNRARTAWAIARALAPGFGLSWLTAPPVRHRLPFTDAGGAALRQILGAALGEPADLDGVAPPAPIAAPATPDFAAVAAMPLGSWPAAADSDAIQIAARAAQLAVNAESAAARASATAAITAARDYARLSDEPGLVQLADESIAGVAGATTAAEVQAWVSWHGEVQSIERRWWHLLVHVALWPAVAALAAPAHARPAAVVAARLLGVDPVGALGAPVVARALARQVFHAGQTFDENLAIVGPGAPHVALVRRAAAEHGTLAIQHAAERGAVVPPFAEAARRFATVDDMVTHVGQVLFTSQAPRGGDGAVLSWGRVVPLAAVDDTLTAATRPRPDGL